MFDSLRHRLLEFLKTCEKMLLFQVAASTVNTKQKKWLAIEQGLPRFQLQKETLVLVYQLRKNHRSLKNILLLPNMTEKFLVHEFDLRTHAKYGK